MWTLDRLCRRYPKKYPSPSEALGVTDRLVSLGYPDFIAEDVALDFDLTAMEIAHWAEAREKEIVWRKIPAPPKGASPVPKYATLDDLLMTDTKATTAADTAEADAIADRIASDPAAMAEYLKSLLGDDI
jgi:hypothetical protein